MYFTVNNRSDADVNGGGRVYAADPVEIDDDDHYGGDDDWSIRVFLPDMNNAENSGYDGPSMGDSVTLVITKGAGVKNPSEEGTHSVGYAVLGPNDGANDGPQVDLPTVRTLAKISLSDEDNDRGYNLTVTGSGFNNGTTAGVYVLNNARFAVAEWWETLDCAGMKAAMGTDSNEYCFHYNLNSSAGTYTLGTGHADFLALSDDDRMARSDYVFSAHLCRVVIEQGANPGGAVVGSDDKVDVTFEVTVPTFQAGDQNYLCMVDGEGRTSSTDVEQFELQPSIRVVPSTVSAGDTVNVFAQDYPATNAAFEGILLAGQNVGGSGSGIGADHSGNASFVVPGGFKGTLRVDATWGGVKEDSKITIAPSELTLSKDEVNANESVTIRGSGFGTGAGAHCLTEATISGADLMLISRDGVGGGDCIDVEVSSGGQFAATVVIWAGGADNPALTAGTHTIEVTDNQGFTGTADIVIKEPTLTVTPEIAGPRDYITISGENWPVDNEDGANIDDVELVISFGSGEDDEDGEPDAAGRWSTTYRVDGDVIIPSTIQVKATYGDSSEIVKVGSFSVPQANLTVTPERVSPGETITLAATGFSLFESEIEVKIGNVRVNVPDGTVTDRDGAIDGLEVIVPSLDPALYTVQMNVGDPATVTIGEVTVVEEGLAGVPSELPEALSELGDNLVAVFYWNDATKQWHFFDPRPEWAELNTLSELVNGQAYWILVSDNQDNVVLNGKNRSLTCAGGSCWNLEVW